MDGKSRIRSNGFEFDGVKTRLELTMQRNRNILLAAGLGAVVGALGVTLARRFKTHLPSLIFDPALLAHHRYVFPVIPWVLFSLYWEAAAKDAAAAKTSETLASRRVHVFLANVALLLQIAPIHGLGLFLAPSFFSLSAGLVVELMGLFLAIWARRALGRNWSGEISIKVEHQLIRSGPYKILRHPIYTGLLVMYVGAALAMGTWLAIVGLAMAAFAYWRKIRLEEKNLEVAFGAEYEAYRRETWALVPGLF
jgi:protein-S-isoprenylcysteine O-methyltransferase Ste14